MRQNYLWHFTVNSFCLFLFLPTPHQQWMECPSQTHVWQLWCCCMCFFIPIFGNGSIFIHKFAASLYKIFNCKFKHKNGKTKTLLIIKYISFFCGVFFSIFFFNDLIRFLYICQLQIFQVLLFAIHITIHAVFIRTRKFYTQVKNYTWTGFLNKNTCATTLQLHIYRKCVYLGSIYKMLIKCRNVWRRSSTSLLDKAVLLWAFTAD